MSSDFLTFNTLKLDSYTDSCRNFRNASLSIRIKFYIRFTCFIRKFTFPRANFHVNFTDLSLTIFNLTVTREI